MLYPSVLPCSQPWQRLVMLFARWCMCLRNHKILFLSFKLYQHSSLTVQTNFTYFTFLLFQITTFSTWYTGIPSDRNHHIQNVTTKASKTLGYLRRNIRTKDKGIRQTAYQTLVRPQVEYASPVWSPYTDTN